MQTQNIISQNCFYLFSITTISNALTPVPKAATTFIATYILFTNLILFSGYILLYEEELPRTWVLWFLLLEGFKDKHII